VPSDRCRSCGSKLNGRSVCVACGYDEVVVLATWVEAPLSVKIAKLFRYPVAPSYRADIPWKRPKVAAGMAAVIIGSGHLYVGKYLEGGIMLALAIVLSWAVVAVSLWALFFLAVIWQWQIADAYDHAVEYDWASIYQSEAQGR
jgi:hypothetical protein